MNKPFSAACERNREPILSVLATHFADCSHVLEIGSGTGQHAVHFAAALPHLVWQCSDRPEHLPGIRMWLDDAALPNTPPPLALDVNTPWPPIEVDAVFSANTLHIMAWAEVERLFAKLPAVLKPGARLVIYGPFRIGGQHTSPSNAAFDASLRAQAEHMGIRDLDAVKALATDAGLLHLADIPLPANNRCQLWQAL
ncbi:DUF938 domain-containing protein [Denitromonas iodatirespirans]|uniref:DUF938 domain-containing protein n=1 Tax=Denitromonas iodatirespirans TaxID=2795389 RepID=A0A944DB12_DENI1|nr:DUF938 domain-containing protein [Denitromonas iodatirespirans]MBT0961731.1 DUF938 domain-containing protein [Denitromonas iodatirespirans]